jgi:flagellar basal-body rod protein FlgG
VLRALNTAATGMSAQEQNVNTISNNIANANTTGFKKSRAEFSDLLYETIEEAGDKTSTETEKSVGHQVGSGAKLAGTRKQFEQGSTVVTQNPYDLMINGDGFFGVMTEGGQVKYTRNGAFNVDAEGNLVTKDGGKVFPGIVVPPNTLHLNVGQNGQVEAFTQGNPEPQVIGNIPIFTFVNQTGLRSEGGNLYGVTKGSGQALQQIPGQENAGLIQQGMLEASNVQVMTEMTNLIKAQRAYEMNSKVLTIADQMLQTVNNVR